METLQREIAAFRERKATELAEARQRVALRLACGIDMPDPRQTDRGALVQVLARLKRAIQRERMKAARAHWSYDLNRHIALKQAHDDLQHSLVSSDEDVPRDGCAANKNGARRRRRKPCVHEAKV